MRTCRPKRLALAIGVATVMFVGMTACSTDDDTDGGAMWTGAAPNMTPVDESTAAEWQATFEEVLSYAEGVPGAWVAVSDPEKGYWKAAIGNAVVDPDQAATIDDHGRIGSITKTFTGTAVLEQVDAGNLSLDDTVADITPDLAKQFPATADLTVEQLLSMQSGLGDYANVPGGATAQAVADPTKIWTPEELIASALEATPVQPVGTPGYSTTNYTILGRMLEAMTGKPVEEVVTDLAKRAGLDQTALLPGLQNEMPDPSSHGYIDAAAVPDLAAIAGVDVVQGTDVTEWSLSWGGAGGGMYSVIDEVFTWTASAMGNTMLSKELGDQRLDFATPIDDAGINYGLALYENQGWEPGWVGHTGQAIGWESLGFYNPETGATGAIMINGTSGLAFLEAALTGILGIATGG